MGTEVIGAAIGVDEVGGGGVDGPGSPPITIAIADIDKQTTINATKISFVMMCAIMFQ